MKELVFASRDPEKTADLHLLLNPLGIRVLTLDDFPGAPEPESGGQSLQAVFENAHALTKFTGLSSLGESSGLRAGSRDWFGDGGAEEARRVLEHLEGKTGDERKASLFTHFVLVRPERIHDQWAGDSVLGRILEEARGADDAIWYDPIFKPDALDGTIAQAAPDQRPRVRSWPRALDRLVETLTTEWSLGESRELVINRPVVFRNARALILGLMETWRGCFFWMLFEPAPKPAAASGDMTLREILKAECEEKVIEPSYYLERMTMEGAGVGVDAAGRAGSSGRLRSSILDRRIGTPEQVLRRAERYGDFARVDPDNLYVVKTEFRDEIHLGPLLAQPELRYGFTFSSHGGDCCIEAPFTVRPDGEGGKRALLYFTDPCEGVSCRLTVSGAFVHDASDKRGREGIVTLLGPELPQWRRDNILNELRRLRPPWHRLLFIEYDCLPDRPLALYTSCYLNQRYRDMGVEYINRFLAMRPAGAKVFCAGYVGEGETDECAVEVFDLWPPGPRWLKESVEVAVP